MEDIELGCDVVCSKCHGIFSTRLDKIVSGVMEKLKRRGVSRVRRLLFLGIDRGSPHSIHLTCSMGQGHKWRLSAYLKLLPFWGSPSVSSFCCSWHSHTYIHMFKIHQFDLSFNPQIPWIQLNLGTFTWSSLLSGVFSLIGDYMGPEVYFRWVPGTEKTK